MKNSREQYLVSFTFTYVHNRKKHIQKNYCLCCYNFSCTFGDELNGSKKPQFKYFTTDPCCDKYWQIYLFFKYEFYIFLIGPKVSTWRVSSLWKQPFRFSPLKIANSFTLLFNTVFVAKLFNPWIELFLFKNEHVTIFYFHKLVVSLNCLTQNCLTHIALVQDGWFWSSWMPTSSLCNFHLGFGSIYLGSLHYTTNQLVTNILELSLSWNQLSFKRKYKPHPDGNLLALFS